MKNVYVCSNTVTGIFSAVYDAWKTKLLEDRLGIALRGNMEQELFCEYIEVEESERKAIAVENLIKKHLGYEAYWNIYHAVLSNDRAKGDAILGAMLEARQIPDSRKIMQHLTHEKVRKVFELGRSVSNEAQYFKEFLRFRELESGILFAQIEPRCQILPCIGDHFSNRLPLENWLIYDKTHSMFLMHRVSRQWVLILDEKLNIEQAERVSSSERVFSKLWKGFFESVSIKERESYDRQRQRLPFRYRENMSEFLQNKEF